MVDNLPCQQRHAAPDLIPTPLTASPSAPGCACQGSPIGMTGKHQFADVNITNNAFSCRLLPLLLAFSNGTCQEQLQVLVAVN